MHRAFKQAYQPTQGNMFFNSNQPVENCSYATVFRQYCQIASYQIGSEANIFRFTATEQGLSDHDHT